MGNNYNSYGNYNKNQNSQYFSSQKPTMNNPVTLCSQQVKQPLSIEYASADVYLPAGKAYKFASELKGIPSSQMRKILDEVKSVLFAMQNVNELTNEVKSKLFMIVPMTAYVYGRYKNYKNLYDFVRTHLNNDTIKSFADIKVFDKLYTCIIAYHKTLSSK